MKEKEVKKLDTPEALIELGCDPVTANFILAIEAKELPGDAIETDTEEVE